MQQIREFAPTEADNLRALADKRNRLIHGELDMEISKDEVERFVAILDTLLSLISKEN
jgi:hypothetical protein